MKPALFAFAAFGLLALFGRSASADVEEKYLNHQKRVFKLFLPGTERRMDDALLEFDKRALDSKRTEDVKKLATSIIVKRFENTTDNQKKALEYFLLVESMNHMDKDLDAVRGRITEIKKIIEKYEAHLADLERRLRKLKNKKARKKKTSIYGWGAGSDVDVLIVGSEETPFFQFKLPVVKPASLKESGKVRDDELEDEISKADAQKDMLEKAVRDSQSAEKTAVKLSKMILDAVKNAYNKSVESLDNTGQI
jgi:hypothetical protein